MKRLLLVALLGLFLLPEQAQAQRRNRRSAPIRMGVTFGVKGGAAFTSLVGGVTEANRPVRKYTVSTKPVVGGLVNYRFTQQLSVQSEILFAPRGSKYSETLVVSPIKTTVTNWKATFTYVDVPVLFKFNAKIFYVEGGAVLSALLSDELENTDNTKLTFADQVNGLDVGYCIGAGVEHPSGGIFGVRFVRSSSSIGREAAPLFAGNQGMENQAIQVTGGFIFNHSGGGRRRR